MLLTGGKISRMNMKVQCRLKYASLNSTRFSLRKKSDTFISEYKDYKIHKHEYFCKSVIRNNKSEIYSCNFIVILENMVFLSASSLKST